MRRPLIAANWKMHGRLAMVATYLAQLRAAEIPTGVELVLCPPAPYLEKMAAGTAGFETVTVGAQDCSAEKGDGAYTGDISAQMLADAGCRWTIVGHSERRRGRGESDAVIAAKFAAAESAGLVPILCVGETSDERQANRAEEVVVGQVEAVIDRSGAGAFTRAVIAYEPVWAIGTGKAATPDVARDMHRLVRESVGRHDRAAAEALRILYGGSVKPDNAAAFFTAPGIDGALVGGASLVPASLLSIAAAAADSANRD
ncbi:MAG: triose-phosphate isomerase [Gammaproteobacteria bacterium]